MDKGDEEKAASAASGPSEGGDSGALRPPAPRTERLFSVVSEVADEETMDMLSAVASIHPDLYGKFDADDLQQLASALTVLRLDPDESLMQVGEHASFVALVLQGELLVHVPSANVRVTLQPGDIVGEMNYFSGGRRTANVTANANTVLALLGFDSMKNMERSNPGLQLKVVYMLAQSAIKVLKGIAQRSASKGGAGSEDALISAPSKESRVGNRNDVHKVEVFYTQRLQKQERIAQELLVREQQRRQLAEHAVANQKYQVLNREMLIKRLQDEIFDKDLEIARLQKLDKTNAPRVKQQGEQLISLTQRCNELQKELDATKKTLDQAHADLDQLRSSSAGRESTAVVQLRRELVQAQQDLQVHRLESSKRVHELEAELRSIRSAQEDARARRDSAAAKLESMKKSIASVTRIAEVESAKQGEQLLLQVQDEHLRNHGRSLQEFKTAAREAQQRLGDLHKRFAQQNQEVEQLRSIQEATARSLQDRIVSQVRIERELQESKSTASTVQQINKHYRQMLTLVTVYLFMLRQRTVRRLRDVYATLASVSNDMFDALDADSEGGPQDATWRTNPRAAPKAFSQLLRAVSDEANKVATVYSEVARQKAHWKNTCNNLFASSIELTSDCMEAKQALQRSKEENRRLTDQLRGLTRSAEEDSEADGEGEGGGGGGSGVPGAGSTAPEATTPRSRARQLKAPSKPRPKSRSTTPTESTAGSAPSQSPTRDLQSRAAELQELSRKAAAATASATGRPPTAKGKVKEATASIYSAPSPRRPSRKPSAPSQAPRKSFVPKAEARKGKGLLDEFL